MRMSKDAWLAIAATIVVAAALVLGFLQLGGPRTQRLIQADQKRVNALKTLAWEASSRWKGSNHVLPPRLDAFARTNTKDPITGAPYEYRVIGGSQYELCATFARADKSGAADGNPSWDHPQGYYCFQLDAARPAQPAFYTN
jgi:hypothetical protein